MKYAFMSFSTPALSLSEMLEAARRYGYDGIEPRIDAKHAHGIEVTATQAERDAARKKAEASGIPMVCIATSLKFADPGTAAQTIAEAHERIDLAGDVGALRIRVFGGNYPQDLSREQAVEQMAKSLGAVVDHAAERGVTLCFETHDSWCDPAHVAAVLEHVNHPSIACNWDIMHPVRTAQVSMDAAFEAVKPWIRHLHIHDGSASAMLPIGTGLIDHRRALELLNTIKYDGYISGEWINWEPYDVHLPRELATMKKYEVELGIA